MFCYKCGTKLPDGAMFCHKCGAQMLPEKEVQMMSEEDVVNSTAEQLLREKMLGGSEDDSFHNMKENVPLKRKSKKLPVLIGSIVLILIAAFTITMAGRQSDDKEYAEEHKEVSDLRGKIDLSETFSDQDTGITFQYPAKWLILDSSGEYNIVEMIDSENTPDHIATFKVSVIFDQDPYGVYTQDEVSVEEIVNEYGKFLSLEDMQFGDISVKVLKFQSSGLRSDNIITFFWYGIGEDMYQVTCSYTASMADTYEPIFEAVMNSYTVNAVSSEPLQEEIFGFETDYREEYIYKIQELSANDESIQFALIDLIDNGVPELVADHPGYDVSLFTCVDEGIITLMDQWSYGAMGNMGYEYLPGQNVIRNCNMEGAGAIVYESYMKVNDSYEIENVYDEEISIQYIRDTNADGIVDGEDEYSDEPVYYCGETEISEEEYTSYQIIGEYEQIAGTMSADAMIGILRGDDEVTENTLEDSVIAIEDYYRLSGIYSDSIGYTNLSLSIYTSQETEETAIGTAVLYMDDEETYLGEIYLLEKGVYQIEAGTGDEVILKEFEGEDDIVLQLYGNGEYIDDYRMIEHYES